jgi:hypothetical protein
MQLKSEEESRAMILEVGEPGLGFCVGASRRWHSSLWRRKSQVEVMCAGRIGQIGDLKARCWFSSSGYKHLTDFFLPPASPTPLFSEKPGH